MTNENRSTTDQILDLLLDALQERQAMRQQADEQMTGDETASVFTPPTDEPEEILPATEPPEYLPPAPVEPAASLANEEDEDGDGDEEIDMIDVYSFKEPAPPDSLPSIQLDKMLRRLAVAVGILIILINIPFNRTGLSLARAMPDAQSLIIRDGLIIKGSGERIYVLEDNQKRWITSLEAFAWFGYRWEQVNVVDDAFLDQFVDGRPLYVLLKCQNSPHIYALEDGEKRWIRDIPTFEAEGFVWEDVKFVSCGELRRLPTGIPIPPDAGPSPEP